MQTITDDLKDLLRSRFQAAARGFRGRIEIDWVLHGVSVGTVDLNLQHGTVIQDPLSTGFGSATNPEYTNDGSDATFANFGAAVVGAGNFRGFETDLGAAFEVTSVRIKSDDNKSDTADLWFYRDDPGDPWLGGSMGTDIAGSWAHALGSTTDDVFTPVAPITARYHRYDRLHNGGFGAQLTVHTWALNGDDVTGDELRTANFRAVSIGIDKSQRMTADQADVVIENESGDAGVSIDSIVVPNAPIRLFQWFGDDANEVQTFDGLIDAVHEHRDVRRTTITARDCMKRLIDQTIAVPSPQDAAEAGAVRTTANYVYLDAEVSDIVADLLDKAGWPAGLRDIFPTGYAVEEFLGTDGASYADTIIGEDRLTGLVGYEAGAREDGYFYFRPALQTTAADADTAAEAVYSYIVGDSGSDPLTSAMVTELDHELDDYDLRTRVKVRGPLTTLKPAWTEVWHTNRYTKPVGLWHDPVDSGFLKILDRGTRKIYRLRQSDRTNVGTGIWPLDISGDVAYPLGLSGDPADSDRFWVLEAAWRATGSVDLSASIHKYDASSGAHLAEYALPDGQWTDIKVSSSFIWLTSFTTDKVHKYNKATGVSIASYTTTYASVAQVNPSGVFVDGTTLGLFFYGKARFLLVDEADPTTTDPTNAIGVGSGVISTAGTKILGGELDTTTDIDLYACSDDLGLVWKFTLANPVDETVWVEVVDSDLEDELGFLGGSADREHDSHPGDADHPFEVRRETIDVKVVTSLAQATETATRWLNLLAHRREVLDLGVVGNPAIQKGDLIHVEDPVTGVDADYVVDTYRTAMEGDTYLGTLALLPANPVY